VPFLTAFWGAAFTIANHFGTSYWVEWRNLGISNGVTVIVLVPAILIATQRCAPGLSTLRRRAYLKHRAGRGYLLRRLLRLRPHPVRPGHLAGVALRAHSAADLGGAALRLGGMCASMLAVTVLAIWGTMHGRGPFLAQSPAENALALQLFLLMVATPLLLLAAAISDERRSKQALLASEERMSLAAESALLALWEWDLAADQVWLTEEGRKLLGLEHAESIDHETLAGRVHPEDRAIREAAIQHTLATGADYESEFRVLLPDGSVRWLSARGRGPGPGKPLVRVLGVAMDITRQKQAAEEAQLQRRELAHLSRVATVSTLSGSLAHELSQPLSSILSNAQAGQRFWPWTRPSSGKSARSLPTSWAKIAGPARSSTACATCSVAARFRCSRWT
jgi:PAS domain S-box-containing protein